MALRSYCGAIGALNALLVLGAPRAALRLDAVAAHGREHVAACSPPITEIRALGHIHRKRGSNARPHMP
jgi:hypothetical protein